MKKRRNATHSPMAEPIQTLKEIDDEIARLQARAASIVAAEKAGVIARIRDAIGYYSLTAEDLGFGAAVKTGKAGRAAKSVKTPKAVKTLKPSTQAAPPADVAAAQAPTTAKPARAGAGQVKFKDDAGNTWSGFGPKPRWLTEALAGGKALDDMRA
jgi:DNA-binding protein H-NS